MAQLQKLLLMLAFSASIHYPPGGPSATEIFGANAPRCFSYDAEVQAIRKTLATVLNQFEDGTVDPADIVVFSDSQSALEAIENRNVALTTGGIDAILTLVGHLQRTYGIEVNLQWIPGHIGLQGNERADTLAKLGSTCHQTDIPTSYAVTRSAIAEIGKERWQRKWAASSKSRVFFEYKQAPSGRDPWHKLNRHDQSTIFRWRTGHAEINGHLNRINPERAPNCRHCSHPYETIEHLLVECPGLDEARRSLLPAAPSIATCLWGGVSQLRRTAKFARFATRGPEAQGRPANAGQVVSGIRLS